MRIERIVIRHGAMPCRMLFSYGAPTRCGFALAQVFAEGHVGTGERIGAPHGGINCLAQGLIGQDARRLDALVSSEETAFDFGRDPDREMLSMALHDLVARAHGVPMYLLLGGARRRRIPLQPCIFSESPEDAGRRAAAFVEEGFRSLKMKLYGDLERDAAAVRAVRRRLPEGLLQGDANRGYKGVQAGREALRRLAEAGLDVAEDPFDGSLEECATLSREFDRPLHMLDAPTRGWKGIHEVCAQHAARAINLHPNCQGPFSEILQRAGVARAAGIPVMVAGTGYPGIGTWAHAHLAAALGLDFPYGDICGVRDHGMPESTAREMLPIRDGAFDIDDRPGHGAEVHPDVLDRYAPHVIEVP